MGVPASPRYGHTLLELPNAPGELLMVGGACISGAAAEGLTGGVGRTSQLSNPDAARSARDADDMRESIAAQRVANAYRMEVAQAHLAAAALEADATAAGHPDLQKAWRSMVQDGARAAASVAAREAETQDAEEELREIIAERMVSWGPREEGTIHASRCTSLTPNAPPS